MDKTTLGLVAALGALAATPALANTPSAAERVMNPTSVAELLDPVSNPVQTLADVNAEAVSKPVQTAQIYIGPGGVAIGHHHHHHHYYRRYHHHHHHHYYHHHHHHHYNY